MMKKAYLSSNVCLENMLDLAFYRDILIKSGWLIVAEPREADLILFSACGVEKIKEDYALRRIKQLIKVKKNGAELVVCGCLPTINEKRLKGVFNGVVFGPKTYEKLFEIAGTKQEFLETGSNHIDISIPGDLVYPGKIKGLFLSLKKRHFPLPQYLRRRFSGVEDSDMFYIKTGIGCAGNCAYCAIKKVKGDILSRPLPEIIEEFRTGLKQGYKRFVLTGDDVGCYGLDNNSNIVDLLKGICSHQGEYELAIRFIEPWWLIKYYSELKQILKMNKIFSLCVPIQSGSNRILQLMNRNYRVEDIVACLKEIRNVSPATMLRTHFIVGFPSETHEDFKMTLNVIDAIDFDLIIPALYYDRPNTAALDMEGKIPYWVGNKRFMTIILKIFFNVYLNKLRFS